jgi:hypothetical protein
MLALSVLLLFGGCAAEDIAGDEAAAFQAEIKGEGEGGVTADMMNWDPRDACGHVCSSRYNASYQHCFDINWSPGDFDPADRRNPRHASYQECVAPIGDAWFACLDMCRAIFEATAESPPVQSVVNDNPDDHLPGGCNNPLLCGGGTTGGPFDNTGGGGGGSVQYCVGCACTPSPGQCTRCRQRCGIEKFTCEANGGSACGEIYSQCISGCGADGLTCVCPSQR